MTLGQASKGMWQHNGCWISKCPWIQDDCCIILKIWISGKQTLWILESLILLCTRSFKSSSEVSFALLQAGELLIHLLMVGILTSHWFEPGRWRNHLMYPAIVCCSTHTFVGWLSYDSFALILVWAALIGIHLLSALPQNSAKQKKAPWGRLGGIQKAGRNK